MLFVGAWILPQEVTIEFLTAWLGVREVVRLDSALCASTAWRHLHHYFTADNCVFRWPNLMVYNAEYIQWCISRKTSLCGACLQIDDATGNTQAHQFLRICGARLQHCTLIGGQKHDTVPFNIPYEALTTSDCLCEFVLAYTTVRMSTLRRALSQRLTLLRFFHCTFPSKEQLKAVVSCSSLTTLCVSNSVDIAETLLISVIEMCPNLRSLSLWNVLTVSDRAFAAIALHLPQLERLFAQNCPVSDAGVCAVARSCRHLQEVYLGALDPLCPITDYSVVEVVRNCTGLQVLWLDFVPGITAQVLREIVARRPNLRMLGVFNMLDVTNMLLRQVVNCCPALTDLSLPASCTTLWDTLEHIAVTCRDLEAIQYCGEDHVNACGTKSVFKDDTVVVRIS
jgi:hypothetical protein